jgi:multiple sugar transport system permease protein
MKMSTSQLDRRHYDVPAPSRIGVLLARGGRIAISYLILVAVAVVTIAPFVAMISVSLQSGNRAAAFPIDWIPDTPTLANYRNLLEHTQILRWFGNSLLVATIGTGIAIGTAATAGYAFARMQFPGRSVLFWAFLAMLMIPGEVTLIPQYMLLSKIGWVNSYQALILPGVTSAFGIFMIRQYLQGLPRDYEEAARMDGASEFQIFWQIVVPMLTPAIATLGTIQFLNYWNEFLYPLIVTSQAHMRTLPVGLATLETPTGGLPETLAGTAMAIIPTVAVFLFFQKYFVRGIATTGLK